MNGEASIVSNIDKLTEYVEALISAGFASRASLFLDESGEQEGSGLVYLGPAKATALLARMSGCINGGESVYHEPVETFELLVRCGAEIEL